MDDNYLQGKRRLQAYGIRQSSNVHWHIALLSLILKISPIQSQVMTMDLHPTAAISVERRRLSEFPNEWFHPESNAIYATIPKEDSANEGNETAFHDFHTYRHLSRYERKYRETLGLDLHSQFGLSVTDQIKLEGNITDQRRRLGSVHSGGYFDQYQNVPVSQGYGTHYANVWVGTPTPQRKTVIVDTGSHYTAFPCTGCKNCGAKHHTDPYFDPLKSKTFHSLTCDQCREGVACENDQCIFSQSYTEGSSWNAYQVKDKFYCGKMDLLGATDPKDQAYSLDFMFGCQTSSTGLFITQLADGIMGMSAHDATLANQMYLQGKIEHNLFALCFRRELGSSRRGVTAGSMTLGGVANSLDTSPMIYAKNIASSGFYTVYVKNIFIRTNGGQSARAPENGDHRIIKIPINHKEINSGKGVIVDSGTTDTYLNKNTAKSFNQIWKQVTKKEYSHSPMRLTKEQLKTLPTILVQCEAYDLNADPSKGNPEDVLGYAGKLDPANPRDLLIAIPATNYMEYSPRTNMYTSRLYFTESSGGVLGSNTLQGHNVVFDWEHLRIGFAESSCAYDKENVYNITDEESFSRDCVVSEPIMSETCTATVDQRLCKNNPTNVMLLGTETWTMTVESPGTESGLSCVEAASKKVMNGNRTVESLKVKCNRKGLCHASHSCEISCPTLRERNKLVLADSTKRPVDVTGRCGDNFWSSCDYNCTQSKVETALLSDGLCHETSRIERPCHKDACGRSDPCRVPFIVHAILVFREVHVSHWTKQAEDVLTEALTKSVHSLVADGKKLFGVGDVRLLFPHPWVEGDDVETLKEDINDSTSKELGLKVSLEVSIFNPSAHVAPLQQQSVGNNATNTNSDALGSMMNNITTLIRTDTGPQTTCQDSDLYSLARNARRVAFDILKRDDFMKQLVNDMTTIDVRGLNESAFRPIYENPKYAKESRLLSSWTIRTDADDEINYFGPPEPLWLTIMRIVHKLAFLTLMFSLGSYLWSSILPFIETIISTYRDKRRRIPGWRGRALYRLVGYDSESDNEQEEESVNSQSIDANKRSTVNKRRVRRSIDNNDIEMTIPKNSGHTEKAS